MGYNGNTHTDTSGRASGGTNAAGNPLDTLIVIGGAGQKEISKLVWSYGANGADIPSATLPLYGRLVVVAAQLNPKADGTNFTMGVNADGLAGGISASGGQILFDVDLQAYQGAITGEYDFDDTSTEGRIVATSGALSILLAAPVLQSGSPPTNIIGKLFVQYRNIYNESPAQDYTFTPISGQPNGYRRARR